VTTIFRFVTIFLTALLAGVSFGIWIGFNPSRLSQWAFLEQQQNMVGSLQGLMISLVVLATITTFISAYLQRQNKTAFISLIVAGFFLISCIIITRFGNLPIDNQVMAWTEDTMPSNWIELRDRWMSFHRMRTGVELVALVLVTWSSIRKD
jgi:ABC-type transport system involved in multi-copper enzyme maturation permease subunit